MRPNLLTCWSLCLCSILFNGCSTTNHAELERSNPEKSQIRQLAKGEPHLIHVDHIERLATLRNGSKLEGFLITIDGANKQTGVLKTLPLRSANSLRTADIIEGRPQINNRIRQANEEEIASLSKIYGDASSENL